MLQGFFRTWGWLLGIGAGVFLLSYLLIGRRKGAAIATKNATGLPGTQSQPGVNGQPVVQYVPSTGDSYTNVNYMLNSGNVGAVNTTTNTTNNPPVVIAPPTVGTPPPPPGDHEHHTRPPVHRPPPPPPVHRPPEPPQPPHPTRPPVDTRPPHYTSYTVKRGDTLSAIAQSKGLTWQQLYGLNKDTIDRKSAQMNHPIAGGPWNNIFPGQVFHVPG